MPYGKGQKATPAPKKSGVRKLKPGVTQASMRAGLTASAKKRTGAHPATLGTSMTHAPRIFTPLSKKRKPISYK